MTDITLERRSFKEVTREPYPDDNWDRGDTSTTWDFSSPMIARKDGYGVYSSPEEFNPGDLCYVVVAVWSTGDSFGYDEGSDAEIFGAYKTYEEAEERVKELEGITGYSVPWNGYFESLDYIEIVSGVLT